MASTPLEENLNRFRKKYFLNKLLRGCLLFTCILLLYLLLIACIESIFRPGILIRSFLFFISIVLLSGGLWLFILRHLRALLTVDKDLSNAEAAILIGDQFSDIGDRLLNTLQLLRLSNTPNSLIQASIEQRNHRFSAHHFDQAIDFKANRLYAWYLLPILAAFVGVGMLVPNLYVESAQRIINYNQFYAIPAPFEFVITSPELRAFKNDGFTLNVSTEGDKLPALCYIEFGNQKVPMRQTGQGQFTYNFESVQQNIPFQLSAAGVQSNPLLLEVVSRPELINFNIGLVYPAHTQRKNEVLINNGNLNVPEGTKITWNISTSTTDNVNLAFGIDSVIEMAYTTDNQYFVANTIATKNTEYFINLANKNGTNRDDLKYYINVTFDLFPTLDVAFILDTVYYESLLITGQSADDYGIATMSITQTGSTDTNISLTVNPNSLKHLFYHEIPITKEMFNSKEPHTFQVRASDNDQINGSKTTSSRIYTLQIPASIDLTANVKSSTADTQKDLEQLLDKNKELNNSLEAIQERLRSQKELQWQEEQLLKDVLKQKSDIQSNIENLSQDMESLNKKQEKFGQRSAQLQEMAEQLKALMDDLLDDETKRLFAELEQLLLEKGTLPQIQQTVSDIHHKEESLQQELERALALFKRIKLESALEKTHKELKTLSSVQDSLSAHTRKKDIPLDSIVDEQNDINNKFMALEEELKAIEELNQELDRPEPLTNTNDQQQAIDNGLEQINDQLKQGNRQKASNMQQETGQKMKALSKTIADMQDNMQSETLSENINDLNQLLDNLIKLSFLQESLIKSFRSVEQIDPRFVTLSQDQLSIKDNIDILSDSLTALSKRIVQISSFVTSELNELNRNIDESIHQLRERDKNKAAVNQQYAMTSMNNLALLLDDLLQQMQATANAQGDGKTKKPGQGNLPSLQEMQKQLSEQIENLQKSGLEGRKLSQELAEMAARQEMIRNELNKLNKQLKGQPGNENANDNLQKALSDMEKNEMDLVNKRITQELINRQKNILSRMLAAENAMKEQELDKEREGQTAKDYPRNFPNVFQDYLNSKEQEIELLETVPVNLHPFYKSEVQKYFLRLRNEP